MKIPKGLTIVAAYEAFACIIISHFPGLAGKWRNIVKEIKRKENHGGDNPFESEDEEKEVLIFILATDFT